MRTYRQWIQMALFQFRALYRNRIALFFNLVLPAILLVVFGTMFGGVDRASAIPIGLVMKDNGDAAQVVRKAVDQPDLFKVETGAEKELRARLSQGKLKAVLILPEGLSARLSRKEPASVVILYDPGDQSSGRAVASLQQVVGAVDRQLAGTAPMIMPEAVKLEAAKGLKAVDFLMAGQLTYMFLNAGLMSVAIWLALQRQNGTLRHMFATPLSLGAFLSARATANLVMALVQCAVIFAVGKAVFGARLPTNLLGSLVVLTLASLTSMGIGLLIGAVSRNFDVAFALGLISNMMLFFLGGAMTPLDGAPAFMQTLAAFLPSHYMMQGLQQVVVYGKSMAEVPAALLIMALTAVVTIGIAAIRLRREILST
jgi:ABC-2 type transport system permease protein